MERIHIAFFGPTNSGKSTLVNALCGQEVSLVSPQPGTTTDPVRKAIELPYGIGPAVLVDTAGIDDASVLGPERKRRTEAVIGQTDVAVVLQAKDAAMKSLLETLREAGIPSVVYEKEDTPDGLLQRIARALPREEKRFLTGNLVKPGDKVVLVDDLIATGGTVEAAAKLIEQLGGEVVKMVFLLELKGLNGRARLSKYDVESVVSYEGK